jgi:hypothetical protein
MFYLVFLGSTSFRESIPQRFLSRGLMLNSQVKGENSIGHF